MSEHEEAGALVIAMKAHEIAVRSEQKIESHEDICAERYTGIKDGVSRVEKDITETKVYIGSIKSEMKTDIQTLFNRMWIAAGATITIFMGISAALFMYLLDHLPR